MQISKEVIEILEYLCDKIGLTIDWTSNNVLPYVEQLCAKFIKWEIGTSICWIAIMLLLIIVGLIFSKVVDLCGMEKCIFGALVIVGLMVIGIQAFDIIECYTFPEKAIYDYIQMHMNDR